MMKNKNGTIILSIILAVQFIIPLSVWSYETYKNKELEEKGQEVKVLIDYAIYDENRVEFEVRALSEAMYSGEEVNYIAFENDGNGFSTIKEAPNKPETDFYIKSEKLYSWYREDWCLKYKSDVTMAQDEYDYYEMYNKSNESENIVFILSHCYITFIF